MKAATSYEERNKAMKKRDDLILERDKIWVDLGKRGISLLGSAGSANQFVSYITIFATELLDTAARMIIRRKMEIMGALRVLERQSLDSLTEENIQNLLGGNQELALLLNDYKILKDSGILELVDDKNKQEINSMISEIEVDIAEMNQGIHEINKELISLSKKGYLEDEYICNIADGVKKIKEASGTGNQSYDPLVIDLNNDGLSVKDKKDGVYFDLDGDGLKEKTGWVSDGDGLLALDLNKNGKIDNGSELLGDDYVLENGEKATSSVEILLSLDKNKDGFIDAKDEVYDTLRVWQDSNHNGISEEEELKRLVDCHIKSINLSDVSVENKSKDGNILKKTISYEKEIDGEIIIGKIGEYLFNKDAIDVKDENLLLDVHSERANQIKALPSVRAFGKIRNLHNAMFLDESNKLVELIEAFKSEESIEEKDKILDEVFIELAGAKDVEPKSRGSHIDARKVAFLEKIFNQDLEKGNLGQRRAKFYEDAYDEVKLLYYSDLIIQTSLKSEASLLTIKDKKLENIDLFNLYLMNEILISPEKEEYKIKEASRVLMYFDSLGIKGFDTFKDYFGKTSSKYLRYIADGNIKRYVGSDGNDIIRVYSDDATVIAGDGDDNIGATFNGHSGNEYFIGGRGNDTISGGRGSDTYFFNLGDGEDTIYETDNEKDVNVIAFGEGIEKDDINIKVMDFTDIILEIKGSKDKITLKNQLNSPSIKQLYFNNGEVLDFKEINEIVHRVDDGDNYIEGNDEDNILEGFKGDDYLLGGRGSDTYIFSKGDGKDVIKDEGYYRDTEKLDKIVFSDINRNEVVIEKASDSDLRIKIKNSEDEVIIKQAHSRNDKIEEIHFADGQVLAYEEIMSKPFEYYGDEEDNEIIAYARDNIIHGGSGNDKITSSSGNDKIYGEAGDDEIYSGHGENLIYGGEGNDKIQGGGGNDTVYGEEGNDHIEGSYGKDILVGGKGDDYLSGGRGSDTYVFSKGDGKDVIKEMSYNKEEKDKIVLGGNILETIIERDGRNLDITFLDREDKITVSHWFSSESHQIEEIQVDEDYVMTNKRVNLLVQAMASFEENNSVDWKNAIRSHNEEAIGIVEQFWIKEE